MDKPVTIVSRQSPLAVAQAVAVRAMLGRAASVPEDDWEAAFPIKTYVTVGDTNLQSSLADVGGKGLFVKEIEAALINGEAQIAVHSMKDMPAEMPPGLVQAAVPPREDPRDAFVTLDGHGLEAMPEGARIGTSSVRRAAQLKRRRPDTDVVPFRGNVGTRLEKLRRGEAMGTFLAQAGLNRLGHDEVRRTPIAPEMMLPALGQGVLCIQTREDDPDARSLCAAISCPDTEITSSIERAFLARLDGSCRTPMAGLAQKTGDGIRFRAEILSLDGSLAESHDDTFEVDTSDRERAIADCASYGRSVADELFARAGEGLKQALGHG